jgi:hypothetical protein
MSNIETYSMDWEKAVARAHWEFYRRHGSYADEEFGDETIAALLSYARDAMREAGWGSWRKQRLTK